MKRLLIFFLVLNGCSSLYAQTFVQLLENGKDIIKKERSAQQPDRTNYSRARTSLQAALKLQPDNAEAHYFMGCAYDYENLSDCSDIIHASKDALMNASAEFEAAIRLSPGYKGEILSLDPYSKLCSVWGCLAFSYMAKEQPDSAHWAFAEGRKRGAFSDFALALYRQLLHDCSPNAILITYGDYGTMNTWYLQEMEHCRPDVTIMNINMLYTPWITKYYYKKDPTIFSSQQVADDTILYMKWEEQKVTVPIAHSLKKFTWTVKPSYLDKYILRSDMVLLDIVKHNAFRRGLYFEKGSKPESILMLSEYLADRLVADELVTTHLPERGPKFFALFNTFPFSILTQANPDNNDDMRAVNTFRYEFLVGINKLLSGGRKIEARSMLAQMDTAIPEGKFPYAGGENEQYIKDLRERVK